MGHIPEKITTDQRSALIEALGFEMGGSRITQIIVGVNAVVVEQRAVNPDNGGSIIVGDEIAIDRRVIPIVASGRKWDEERI